MDPRHPELAISRMRELMKQYDRIESDMSSCTVANRLGQLEREASLVIQEICLVAPRLHEAMMQTSRQRRYDLSRGNVYEQMREYAATAERIDEPVENSMGLEEIVETLADPAPVKEVEQLKEVYVAPNQAETVIVEPKPRKKRAKK